MIPSVTDAPSGPSGALADHAPSGCVCVGCGYIVGTMPVASVCPECATPVAKSLQGDVLGNADPDYVRTISRGLTLVLLGTLTVASWWVATPIIMEGFVRSGLMSFQAGYVVVQSIDFLGAILLLSGWWLASSPNPAVQDPANDYRARRLLRGLLILIAAITALGFVGVFVPAFAKAGLGGISGNVTINSTAQFTPLLVSALALRVVLVLARVVRFFVALRYLRVIAERVPDRTLAASVRRQTWLFPLSMTVGWLVVVGPLIGVALYFIMLFRMRQAVARVSRRDRGQLPTSG
jgi:hypothetical protein